MSEPEMPTTSAAEDNLNSWEKRLVAAISDKDVTLLKQLLLEKGPDDSINFTDEHGMTPLQHAAYKGSSEMCQLVLDHGGDVNAGQHDHGYTALHFSALSGSEDVCRLLLEVGAKMFATNSVGRTAAQMGAFVGNHHCVAVINNFVPKEDVAHFAKARGLDPEPKLPPILVDPLHKLILQANVHPVKVFLYIQSNPLLAANIRTAAKVLDLMTEREMKRGTDTNELTSLKCHFLHEMLMNYEKERPNLEKKIGDDASEKDVIALYIKVLLKGRSSDGALEYLDEIVRVAVRSYPYRECTTFQQLVANLSQVKIGEYPLSIHFVNNALSGQRGGFRDTEPCTSCSEEKATRRCAKCKSVQYCNRECQRLHWSSHKKFCEQLAASAPVGKKDAGTEVDDSVVSASASAPDSAVPSIVVNSPE